jgi:hypothetical protein
VTPLKKKIVFSNTSTKKNRGINRLYICCRHGFYSFDSFVKSSGISKSSQRLSGTIQAHNNIVGIPDYSFEKFEKLYENFLIIFSCKLQKCFKSVN